MENINNIYLFTKIMFMIIYIFNIKVYMIIFNIIIKGGVKMKIEFFEPPMCCSTGLCGPSPDERLVKLGENIEFLKKKYPGITIERYMISQQPLKFKENEEVFNLVKRNGKNILPITTVNEKVIKTHDYATLEEMEAEIQK